MVESREVNRWLIRPRASCRSRLRLYCFPYAGAGASIFSSWAGDLPPEVELVAVQLAGRESRYTESCCLDLAHLIQFLTPVVQSFTDLPFVFYGHSMGGIIGFELARECRRKRQQGPIHLIVSGCRAPQLPDPHPPMSAEADPVFIDRLRQLGGTTEAILEDAELTDLLLPTLRADFAMCEAYSYSPEDPLECSITAFGGTDDSKVREDELSAWQFQTSNSFKLKTFPGQHFYIHSSQELFLKSLSQDLAELLEKSTLSQ